MSTTIFAGLPMVGARGPEARGRLFARVGVASLLAASLLICVSAARSSIVLPETLRPLPGWLAGPFAGAGGSLGLAALIVVSVVLLVSYGVAANTAQRLSPRTVIAAILVLHAMVLLAPPLFSSDVFTTPPTPGSAPCTAPTHICTGRAPSRWKPSTR